MCDRKSNTPGILAPSIPRRGTAILLGHLKTEASFTDEAGIMLSNRVTQPSPVELLPLGKDVQNLVQYGLRVVALPQWRKRKTSSAPQINQYRNQT